MKINWGTGILIVIIIFLIAMISFVIFTTSHKVNLVEKDYYPKGLKYDNHMEKSANALALEEQVGVARSDSGLIITFPDFFLDKKLDGKVLFYRPSDAGDDKSFEIKLDTNLQQHIPAGSLVPGRYVIKIDWNCDSVSYYQEIDINN
jgi:hypothetical protein